MDFLVSTAQKIFTSPPVKEWLKQRWIDLEPQLRRQLFHLKAWIILEESVRQLKEDVDKLKHIRDSAQPKVDEEVNPFGVGIPVEVKEWIISVNHIIREYEDFIGDERHELATLNLFANGYCLPRLGVRCCLIKEAQDITKKANGLLHKANDDELSFWLCPTIFYNFAIETFPSRNKTIKNIKAALKDPSVRMIGVHGRSGVGKTTLVKEIAKQAFETNMFGAIAMVNITRNPDIRNIQGQIAHMLGITIFDEESDIARAAQIQKRLKRDGSTTLIILDDIWEKLDFNMLGINIPSENDDGDRYREWKVLLISESKPVLSSQMELKKNNIFSVEVLNKKEAVTLFKRKAGIDIYSTTTSEFQELAAQIANKFNGLPMSIVTSAMALKDKSHSVWEDVHKHLERGKPTETPEFAIRLSYELLEDEELKQTFLLCACMGQDALIVDLVKYCIGLGFLQGMYTVKEARDRVHELVRILKASGLLSDVYSNDHFTMQDIVRSAALSIASMENHAFTMTNRKVDEWPDEDKLQRYATIFLHHCDIVEGFPSSISCPRLRVFHVNNNDPSLEIPKYFFKGMKKLKVLKLTGIRLSPSDLSIGSLTELRMLCLEQCMLDEDLSFIGRLRKLRILSFSGSDIEKLPVELKQLINLQILDISNCSRLREIPANVISSLISLEELYMRNTFIPWGVGGQTYQSENASLSELRFLQQLTTLDIQFPTADYLPKNLFFDKLQNYKIVVGDSYAYLETDVKMPEMHEALRFLAIQLNHDDHFNIHSQPSIKMLFKRVESLLLEDLEYVEDIFSGLDLKGFQYLKHLCIVNNSTTQFLINPNSKVKLHSYMPFPKLESLYLSNLKNMHKICSSKLSGPSFGKLKVIKINLCGRLRTVFSSSVVALLTVLETFEVSECNSLREIVEVETQSCTNNTEIRLPELSSLTLQSLSNFIGFYPNPSLEERIILFNEQVVVPKLKRMKLSSIPIDLIWSYQPSQRSYFQNLIHLDVNGCWNLEYLSSFSMAKCLVNLQSLFISECGRMEYIIPQGTYATMKSRIFPNLKILKLRSMKRLKKIWSCEFPVGSFGNLDTLIIEDCDILVTVFSQKDEIYQSICNLRVTDCKSMEVIFGQDDGDITNLQDVHLEALPKLKHVWRRIRDRDGIILNLNNLQKIQVHDCVSLENIFPASAANRLDNLQYLLVLDCFELREIVAYPYIIIPHPSSFSFPKLTTIKFSQLPKLECFYPQAHELRCPALNDLTVERCYKLDAFGRKGTVEERIKPILFPQEVIHQLKSMQIEWNAMGQEGFQGDNVEELGLSGLMNAEIPYSFLHTNPSLERLSLNKCLFEAVVPLNLMRFPGIKRLGVVPDLKSLKLMDLPTLKGIGFERDTVLLRRIEFLILKNCPRLVNIIPSSVSLTHLTILEVVNCNGLQKLMSPSAAKSLAQLNTMKVIKCESLKEIVDNEEEEDYINVLIQLKLKVLELVSLKNLTSFSSSESYVFEFPSLEKLVVSACPKMENFSKRVKNTPALRKIYVTHEQDQQRWCWNGDIESTIKRIFINRMCFEGMDMMSLSEHWVLQQAWQGAFDIQSSWFHSLKTLKLENCEILQPYAVPCNILPYLKSLRELEVRNCHKVEVIFEMNAEIMKTTFQLKKLTLASLDSVTHVWENNCHGILGFQYLQQVFVRDCGNLQTLFPATLAKNLRMLENLEIQECNGLLEIVGKDEDAPTDVTEMFVFPCLASLNLRRLPILTQTFTLKCPALKKLSVWECEELEVFQSHQEANPLFSDLEVIFKLEELSLDSKHTWVLRSEILGKAPSLEIIRISNCDGLKIFPTQDHEISEEDEMVHDLKILDLRSVYGLKSIGSENSLWLKAAYEKLHQLHVSQCPDLTTLIHPAVSVFSLKELYILDCPLEYLFTSSAVSRLMHLEHIEVKECKSMREIVAREEDETTSEGIKFERLNWIVLENLSSLEYFYSGNASLLLPSLIQVGIKDCLQMKSFSQGFILAESFRGIHALDKSIDLVLSDDLNVSAGRKPALQQSIDLVFGIDLNVSVEKAVLLQQVELTVGDSPLLQDIWLKLELPTWCFCNLKSLVLEGCEFLSNAIPSHLFPLLTKLEELQVRKCNFVKAIFDHTNMIDMEPASRPLSIPLKKLILDQLPMLEHVWNEDPERSLTLPFLEEVSVDGCESIKSLFPASVVFCEKNSLKILRVENCLGIVEIVAKDETGGREEANKEVIIFPSVTSLRLWNLPNLKRIYPGMHILKWPMLNELDVFHCPMLQFVGTEFQNSRDSDDPEGQDDFTTDHQPFISLQKDHWDSENDCKKGTSG